MWGLAVGLPLAISRVRSATVLIASSAFSLVMTFSSTST